MSSGDRFSLGVFGEEGSGFRADRRFWVQGERRILESSYFLASALGLLTHRFPAVWVLGHQAAREPCVVTVVLGQTGQFSVCQGAK